MKKFQSFLAAFAVSVAKADRKPFINKNGEYKLFDEKTDIVPTFKPSEDCPQVSFNYYTYCLGYGTGGVISYFANRDGAHKKMSIELTNSLSATGSKNLPKSVT